MAWNQFTRDATTHDVRADNDIWIRQQDWHATMSNYRPVSNVHVKEREACRCQATSSVSDVNVSLESTTSPVWIYTLDRKSRITCHVWCSDSYWWCATSNSVRSVWSIGGVRLSTLTPSTVAALTLSELRTYEHSSGLDYVLCHWQKSVGRVQCPCPTRV